MFSVKFLDKVELTSSYWYRTSFAETGASASQEENLEISS